MKTTYFRKRVADLQPGDPVLSGATWKMVAEIRASEHDAWVAILFVGYHNAIPYRKDMEVMSK